MQYEEDYLIEHADTFDWDSFSCDMNFYSKDFIEQFKSEIQTYVWRNSIGEYHREDGPAIKWDDGSIKWYWNGRCHREDGPAFEQSDGYKSWWINGIRHREDGPAVEYSSGNKEWYINGKFLNEQQFNKWNTQKNIL